MKTLIIVIFMVLVIAGMIWSIRKSRAEADLARRKSLKHQKNHRKKAITPDEHVTWPVIIRPVKSQLASGAEDHPDDVEEPTMTAVEYEPPERVA